MKSIKNTVFAFMAVVAVSAGAASAQSKPNPPAYEYHQAGMSDHETSAMADRNAQRKAQYEFEMEAWLDSAAGGGNQWGGDTPPTFEDWANGEELRGLNGEILTEYGPNAGPFGPPSPGQGTDGGSCWEQVKDVLSKLKKKGRAAKDAANGWPGVPHAPGYGVPSFSSANIYRGVSYATGHAPNDVGSKWYADKLFKMHNLIVDCWEQALRDIYDTMYPPGGGEGENPGGFPEQWAYPCDFLDDCLAPSGLQTVPVIPKWNPKWGRDHVPSSGEPYAPGDAPDKYREMDPHVGPHRNWYDTQPARELRGFGQ